MTVSAHATDANGVDFRSAVVLLTDDSGNVDLATSTPINGSYLVADATGLLWSLQAPVEDAIRGLNSRFLDSRLEPYTVTITAEGISGRTATATATRIPFSPEVVRSDIDDAELVGTVFLPAATTPLPVVLVVPGSDGGVPEHLAALYASHGYAAVALAYFKAGDRVPATLTEIPLEYFERAFDWIAQHPGLDEHRIVINGTSRGGELALLLGARYPQLHAVIAWVPSDHLHPAIQASRAEPERASWTHGGQDLPYLSHQINPSAPGPLDRRDGGYVGSVAHLRRSADAAAVSAAEIAVEKTNGPILIISGRDDTLWPSAVYGDRVLARLSKNGFAHEVTHLSYENAGHTIGVPNSPATLNTLYWTQPGATEEPLVLPLGGTPQGIAAARADAWPRVLDFLARHTV